MTTIFNMTLYFNNKKYKIDIIDVNDSRKELKIYKKMRFIPIYSCLNCVDITFDKNHKFPFPRPSLVYTKENRSWSRHCFISNKKHINDNMDYYFKNLIDMSFQIDDIEIGESYKSMIREQRLKKLLTN